MTEKEGDREGKVGDEKATKKKGKKRSIDKGDEESNGREEECGDVNIVCEA